MTLENLNCPCGSQKLYKTCCEIAHLNLGAIKSAEQLMRSRYVAFTMAMGDYLMATHHSTTRPLSEKKAIVNWAKSVQWDHLDILKTTKGQAGDNEGTVEFNAYFFEKGVLNNIHEQSQFVKEQGLWMYLGFVE